MTGEFTFFPGQKLKSNLALPPPPAVSKKYLQIIGNVPYANVVVNNQPRGQLDNSGVLNLADLVSAEVEVSIDAPGYASEKQTVELVTGQWRQLNVILNQPM